MSGILVRLPNWIGDAVMATPAIRLLIEREGPCSVWGPPPTAVLFEHFPGVERIFPVEEKKSPEVLESIQAVGFDKVYLLTNSYSTAKTAKSLGIPKRIGYRRDWRGLLLTRGVICWPWMRYMHMVDYYLHLLPSQWRSMAVDRQPRLFLSEEEIRSGKERLGALGVAESMLVVSIASGAAFGSAKCWESEWFRETAQRLAGQGCFVAVSGTEKDREQGEFILSGLPAGQGVNLAGQTNLRELMALISLSACLITNDSGPMHLADAVGTPAVALFGSTDSSWTGPQATHHVVLQSEVTCSPCFLRECPLERECMKSLSVERVFQAVSTMTGKATSPPCSPLPIAPTRAIQEGEGESSLLLPEGKADC